MIVLITENQKDRVLKDLVKNHGWKSAGKVVGLKYLINNVFNNDPINFLNLFDDLERSQSIEYPGWTLYRDVPNHNLMIYDNKGRSIFINHDEIWSVLSEFGLTYDEKIHMVKKWLDEVYYLKVSDISTLRSGHSISVL